MDLSNIDIPEIVAFAAGIGGLVKGFLSGGKADKAEAKAKEIEEARAATKISRDNEVQELRVQIAVLQEKGTRTDARLKEGNEHFVRVENEIKETNGLLRELLGAFKNQGGKISDRIARDSRFEL
jgi:peptidoglycan hydrolase CwlO-like protein